MLHACLSSLLAVVTLSGAGAIAPVHPSPGLFDDDVKRLAVLTRNAKNKRVEKRVEAYEELLTRGREGDAVVREVAEAHLTRELETLRKALKKGGSIVKREKRLRAALDEARAEALRIIFDRAIYPDEDHGRVGQPVVDEAVERVRLVWERPAEWLYDQEEDVAALFDAPADSMQWIELANGALPDGADSIDALLDEANAAFEPEAWVAKSTLEWNRTIRKYHDDGLFTWTDQERIVVDKTNEYRWMMGLRCVEADERLIRAARSHSEEMISLGYFAHQSPTPERSSPSKRAGLFGYPGGVAENIARTRGGAGAFSGWYHSSGHHRNMLGRRHVQIGSGGAGPDTGSHFTQVFGSSSSVRGRKVTDPELLYLGRVRDLDAHDADAQATLAAWCHAQSMPGRLATHAEAAIALDPDHKKARALLGFRRVPGAGWTRDDG